MNDSSSMTSRWLRKSTEQLESAGITTARLDCLVLLEDITGKDRSWLLAHPDMQLSAPHRRILKEQLAMREKHVPLSYIRGKSEFFGREFIINEHTLEPRPETETMIELALGILDSKYVIVDVGTGSGAIAITMKLEQHETTVLAMDIDETCIITARKNAKKLGADVQFFTGDLLMPLSDIKYQISDIAILANLPYVPDSYKLNLAATHEPKHAIFGGKDGLDLYRRLFIQTDELKIKPMHIITESLPFQHKELASIASEYGYVLRDSTDFIQHFALPAR